jgi:hypothetical protein
MSRNRSGKTLTEWLVILAVLLGLTWMLAAAGQRVYAAANGQPGSPPHMSFKIPNRGHAR